MTEGRWLDLSDADDSLGQGAILQNWQAPGCLLRHYNARDIGQCLKGRQIRFIGDSTIRQIFWATAAKLDAQQAYVDQHRLVKHNDLAFKKDEVSVFFKWDPYLNSTSLSAMITGKDSLGVTAAVTVVGGGLWHARYLKDAGLTQWKKSIGNITGFFSGGSDIGMLLHQPLRVLSPVQIPLYEALSDERRRSINPSVIESMNTHLVDLYSQQQRVQVPWAFTRMLDQQPAAYDLSGLHQSISMAEHFVDILLNLRCNALLSTETLYPMDMTCCSSYAERNRMQKLVLLLSVTLVGVGTLLYPIKTPNLSTRLFSLSPPLWKAFGVVGMALVYAFYADRTQLFEKAQKQYSYTDFKALLAAAFLVGLLTVRRSGDLTHQGTAAYNRSNQSFLSRDQSDEWKGWMQIIILAYHYTGASKVLVIYQFIRLLVASYLFLTGFGHTVFYIKKPDYSLRRFALVIVRLNLLSILLPYVMRTDYLLYYFAPLTSFFYLMVFMTMYLGHRRNHDIRWLTGKIMICAAITNVMVGESLFFGTIFNVLERTCNIHWNLHEWRFRVQLDGFIVFAGMLSGAVFLKMTAILSTENESSLDPASRFCKRHFNRIRITAIIFAFVTLPVFYVFASTAINKYVYNYWVPYTSVFPILSFIILRNSTQTLRHYHSAAFAFIGKISLETFTLQFHIWLAGDTKGLLRTGLLDRWCGSWADMALLTVLFLWLANNVSHATQVITNHVVDPDAMKDKEHVWQPEMRDAIQPQTHEKDVLMVEPSKTAGISGRTARWISLLKRPLAADLRIRLVLIALILWVLNWVSRGSNSIRSLADIV